MIWNSSLPIKVAKSWKNSVLVPKRAGLREPVASLLGVRGEGSALLCQAGGIFLSTVLLLISECGNVTLLSSIEHEGTTCPWAHTAAPDCLWSWGDNEVVAGLQGLSGHTRDLGSVPTCALLPVHLKIQIRSMWPSPSDTTQTATLTTTV